MNEKEFQKVISILVKRIEELELRLYYKDVEIKKLKETKEENKND